MSDCEKEENVQELQTALKELGLEFTPDGQYVRWANTNPKHPRNWPTIQKAYNIGLIIFLEFYTTSINASGATTAKDARHEFEIDLTLAVFLFVSTYALAQAFGNVVFPPYSEAFGRKKLDRLGFGRTDGHHHGQYRRHVQYAGPYLAGVCLYGGSQLRGGHGPCDQWIYHCLRRRWVYYISGIVTGLVSVLLLGIRESRPSLLLTWEVEKLRHVTGVMNLQALNPDEVPKLRIFVRDGLIRPLRLFFTEPIVFACSLMSGCSVALLYLFTESLPTIYESMGFAQPESNLPFIAMGIGFLPSILIRLMDGRIAAQRHRDGLPLLPENKLAGICLGAPFLAVGLWWFAWMVPPTIRGVHWLVTLIPLFFVGFALNEFGTVLAGYLADSYHSYAASAFAAMSLARSLLSSIFPLVAPKMFGALGANIALSVLAAGAMIFCPVPFIFRYYGQSLRQRSKFAQYSLRVYEENTVEREY